MNDLERDLRELLGSKASDAPPPATLGPRVLRRAHRRLLGTMIAVVLSGVAILAGSIVGVRALTSSEPSLREFVIPALPNESEGFRAVALPYLSLSYPEDWSLVSLQPDETRDRVLQLANFDIGPGFGACEQGWALPAGGVLLEVRLGALQDPPGPWPTSLDVVPGDTRACGAQTGLAASWGVNNMAYSAAGLLAPNADQDDVELMKRSFESLIFPDTVPQTESLFGASNLVVDSAESPVGPVVLYAYEDLDDGTERATYGLGIAGPAGSQLSGAIIFDRETPIPVADEGVTMNLGAWGGVVWGDVAESAARAELRTVEGGTYPAALVQLPESLGLAGLQAVWGFIDEPTKDRVTTLLYDPKGSVMNDHFPTGPRTTIASGEDSEGGPWELYLESTSDGVGLGFGFVNGGGGGCCLRPLKSDFQLDGWGSGSDEPSHITTLASEAVARIEFEATSGERIEGDVYPVPDASLEIPQIGLVIVPREVPLEGFVVGYDSGGSELGRAFVGESPEPVGVTPEIDAVWQSLYRARDAAARYFEREDAFSTLSLDALADLAKGPVTFSSRPDFETVSVFVTDDRHLAVSSTAITGEAFCIAVEAPGSPNSSFNYRYGPLFAESYDDCRGGWFET